MHYNTQQTTYQASTEASQPPPGAPCATTHHHQPKTNRNHSHTAQFTATDTANADA
jgi:hypothetical protein